MPIDPLELAEELRETPYEVVGRIGRGAMGEVFEVRHRRLRRAYVVKVLRDPLRTDLEDRLRLEAQALAALRHPNLLEVVDFSTTLSGRPFLVTERLVGETLRARVERGPVATHDACAWIAQVLAGLECAHRAGLVHRDIKLENLFLCAARELVGEVVKVIDFGVVKIVSPGIEIAPLESPTAHGIAVGTPRTMAPEQRCAAAIDRRADLYAVGVVLFQLLTGTTPAEDLEGPLARLHPRLSPILRRALELDPSHRFQSAEEMSAALAPFCVAPLRPRAHAHDRSSARRGAVRAIMRGRALASLGSGRSKINHVAKVVSILAALAIVVSVLVLLGTLD